MAGNQHLIDPLVGKSPTNFEGMGFTPQEIRALQGGQDTPGQVIGEFRQQDAQESAAIERYELERIQAENDRLRSELGQSQQAVSAVRNEQANLAGQVQAMQAASLAAQAQATLDSQFRLTQEEIEAHGEVLPLVEKVVGRTAAQIQADYDAKLQAELERVRQETSQPLQSEIEALRQQSEVIKQQTANQNAARLNSKISELGLGSIDSLTQNEEFRRRHASPVYPGSNVQWGQELSRHITEGNIASAEAMLEDFRNNSQTFKQRDDVQVPAGRVAAPPQPMTTEKAQNLQKREHLQAIYQQRMEDANNGIFPEGMNRFQYKEAQNKLLDEIDKIPTT